jgi:DNA ligase (NAD+)|uniref:DNA polymerase lambda n=1 Tax=viral metagenome TaxID=1070528 RepID=A0A6C0IK24_9ZZZZ
MSPTTRNKSWNQEFSNVLSKSSELMMKKGDVMKARAYSRARDTILRTDQDIKQVDQLKNTPTIGATIYDQLEEYTKTGKVALLEQSQNDPLILFTNVYGIGPKKAEELVKQHNIRSIVELREKQDRVLNNIQRIGLKYYEDILERIPRNEIAKYDCELMKTFKKVSENGPTYYEVVGSYRRGATNSGDIDIIITSDDRSVFHRVIDELISKKMIIEVLSRGDTKCLVVAKLTPRSKARRVDFMFTTKKEYPFAILYFTGSKDFNTSMRAHALKMGMSMNEHGFTNKNNQQNVVYDDIHSEKDVFDKLKLVYVPPDKRIDGRSLIENISKDNTNSPILNKNVINYIKDFKQNGLSVLKKLNEETIMEIISQTNDAYYNSNNPLLTDNEFDIVKEYAETKYERNEVLQQIGAPVGRNKVDLPFHMPSMDKIKPDTNILDKWKKKYNGPYVLSCKLDGVSGLYSTQGSTPKLYTRGDGKIGQDISHLIPYLKLPKVNNVAVRGEFIIKKQTFDQKYKHSFANPRNMVSGIINSKQVDKKIHDLDFVAYEMIVPSLKPSSQMKKLQELSFQVVQHTSQKNITNEYLSSILVDWRTNHIYEIDGIIVGDDHIYPRTNKNPEHAFAFKMVISDQVAEAKVVDVEWNVSKTGYLKPRVEIEPIKLGGVTIKHATGFNGNFIETNKIGVGAIIELIRSGDVIPYIKSVIAPAENAKMPNVPYTWNNTHIDIMIDNFDTNETLLEKRITNFFTTLEVESLSSGNVKRIINAGYNSIPKILRMTKQDFNKVDGFKDKMAEKVYNSIQDKVRNANIAKIAVASNVLGRGLGERKITPIMEAFPDIFTSSHSKQENMARLQTINGIGKENATSFVNNMDSFVQFLKNTGLEHKLVEKRAPEPSSKRVNTSHPLYNQKVVMTKVRDADIIAALKNNGGELVDNVKKGILAVVTKNTQEVSNKLNKAKEMNIPIMSVEEFKQQYMK